MSKDQQLLRLNPFSYILKYLNPDNFWIISLIVFLTYRIIALVYFGLTYTDSDQVVIWHSAKDFASGIFMEPCYYGQAYNSNLEGLLAVPFVWMGIKPYLAVPLVSSLMSAIPIVLFSNDARKNHKPLLGALVIWLSFLLPDAFTELSIMSRGFIQGIFCVVCGLYLFLHKQNAIRVGLGMFFIFMGVFQNINALMFVLPVFAVLAMEKKWWNFKIVGSTSIALIAAYLLKFFAERFYQLHPAKNTHYVPSFAADWGYFKDHIQNLDTLLLQTFPKMPSPTAGFVLFVLALLLLHKFNKKSLIFISVLIFMFLASLFLAKLDNYSNSIFFGQGRFFLAIPYVILFFIAQAKEINLRKTNLNYIIPLALLFGILFCGEFVHNLKNDQSIRNDFSLSIQTIPELKKHCLAMQDSLKKEKISTVLVGNHWAYNLAGMGCTCMLDSFPFAIRTHYERRTWLFDSAQARQPGKLLLMHTDTMLQSVLDSAYVNRKTNIWGQSYIINTGNKTVKEFIDFYGSKILKN